MRNRIVDLVEQSAADDPNTLFMTGDLGFSVIEKIQARLGERFINAGVAEANMATMAGSLAMLGFRVYIYSIAPFVTLRCVEQLRNDVCYQGGNVRIIGIGAGLSYGTLGPSHHSLEDAALLGSLPRMRVVSPGGPGELDAVFRALEPVDEPIYFRIGRESGIPVEPPALTVDDPAWIVRDGADATVLACGAVLGKALDAAERLKAAGGPDVRVVSVPVIKPFPTACVDRLLADGPVVTVMEAYPGNPLEVGAMELLLARGTRHGFRAVNVAHSFPKVAASHDVLRERAGVSTAAVEDALRALTSTRQPFPA